MKAKLINEDILQYLKPKELNDDLKLGWLAKNFYKSENTEQEFKDLILRGAKLNKTILKQIYDVKPEYNYQKFLTLSGYERGIRHQPEEAKLWRLWCNNLKEEGNKKKNRIKKFLQDNFDKVNIDPNKREDIRNLIFLYEAPTEYKKYPRGYKLYRVLKLINDKNVSTMKQLTKFVYELGYGENTWDGKQYWGDYWPTIKRYFFTDQSGRFKLTREGKNLLNKLYDKFKDKNIDSLIKENVDILFKSKSKEEIDKIIEPMLKHIAQELFNICMYFKTYLEAYEFVLKHNYIIRDKITKGYDIKDMASLMYDYFLKIKLNEDLTSYLKPKSKEEIDEELENIFDQMATYLVDMGFFEDYLEAYETIKLNENRVVSKLEDKYSWMDVANMLVGNYNEEVDFY